LRKKIWPLMLLSGLLTSCSLTPPYQPPAVDIPCAWHSKVSGALCVGTPEDFLWWESLHDPILDSLITRAWQGNFDLSIAATRILEARGLQKGSDAYLYPHLDGSMNYAHAEYNKQVVNRLFCGDCCSDKGGSRRSVDLFEVGFDAEWEIDLFGMHAHEASALKAKVESSQAEFCHVWITLSAEVARVYIELRSAQQQLQVIENDLAAQSESLHITNGLIQAGFLSTVDQWQAEEQLQHMIAQKPLLQLSIYKAIHRLSILLGQLPGDLFAELSVATALPCLPCQAPIGIPAELLRRRPDIVQAERELAAAAEMEASAVAALFPRLSLRGFVGEIGTALVTGSFAWWAGPQLLLPIFNSRLLEQDVYLNQVKARRALYEYQQAVLLALEEAENAIAAFSSELGRNQALFQAQKASQEAYDLTLQLYHQGMRNYLEVLARDRSLLVTKKAYLESQSELIFHYIALYKVLGGCWCVP